MRVSIEGLLNAQPWANVFWCNLSGGASASQANLDTWLNAFQAAYKTAMAPTGTTDVQYVQAKATLFQTGGTVLHSVVAMTGTGSNGTGLLNDNSAAMIISWLSAVYWRGGKPRTYLPGIKGTDVTSGKTIASGIKNTLNTAGGGFLTAVNALSAGGISATALGFVSFRSGNADRPSPLFFPITGHTVHSRLGTQRRRLGRWTT